VSTLVFSGTRSERVCVFGVAVAVCVLIRVLRFLGGERAEGLESWSGARVCCGIAGGYRAHRR
jgi:hypothetical protein